ELPIAIERGVHNPIGRTDREALVDPGVEFPRLKDREHHELIEVGAFAPDARLFAHHRMRPVTSDHIIRFEHLALPAYGLVNEADANAMFILLDRLRGPTVAHIDARQARHALAQDILKKILRQPVVLLKIVLREDLATLERVPVIGHQVAVGHDTGGRDLGRQQTLSPHFIDAAPEIKVFEGTLRQILALRNVVHPEAALDQGGGHATLGEIDRKAHAHGTTADDYDLTSRAHLELPINPVEYVRSPAFRRNFRT